MRSIIFSIFLIVASAYAQQYFVKLTPAGRQQVFQDSALTSKNLSFSEQQVFKKIVDERAVEPTLKAWFLADGFTEKELKELQAGGIVEVFDPVGSFRVQNSSSDPLVSEQWYLDKIEAYRAWSINRGSSDVIIAVIDTGVDYEHDDLQGGLWINAAEDINGNGRLDKDDLNGIDEDGNGYADDLIGYDFTDAPRFADSGDYLMPDPDPMDEFQNGHGTQASGIISAQSGNGIGISGIAPGCRVMCLRAGTASGYLEEDDVARAVLYAVDNGAQIINMSFGDKVVSRFLRDVIDYAWRQNVLVVASAGNSASNETHYPSGLSQTVSVGASTPDDQLAGFSNFGSTIDLIAPGVEMVSTAIGNGYNSVNGTSFSAPVVSAVAGLLLSQNPQLSPEQLRNLLKTSSEDLFSPGWDERSGAGRLNAFNALKVPAAGEMAIDNPQPLASAAGDTVVISGRMMNPDLAQWGLSYGLGQTPQSWTEIRTSDRQIADTLALFNISDLPDTLITLRLYQKLTTGAGDELRRPFYIDRTAPVIKDVQIVSLLDGADDAALVQFSTDDVSTARLILRDGSDNITYVDGRYETRNHRIKLDYRAFPGTYTIQIEAENTAGLVTTSGPQDPYRIELQPRYAWQEFRPLPYTLPKGYMLPQICDFDEDGNGEIVISRYNENHAFGLLQIYEFNGSGFDLRAESTQILIPRAAGDVDGDGKGDILAGFGQESFLLEAEQPNGWPTQIAWQGPEGFWAAGYADSDKDGKQEIIGYREDAYLVLENSADNSFSETARLANSTGGGNRFGVPRFAITDLDGNGRPTVYFGDYDGDVLAFENVADNSYRLENVLKTIHPNSTEMLAATDEGLFMASHTPELNTENEFDARYWSVQFLGGTGSADTVHTFGYRSTREFDSGLTPFQANGESYVAASFYPDLFIFKKTAGGWQPVWHKEGVRSNSVLAADLDNDGVDEIYFNNGEAIVSYALEELQGRPVQPHAFRARALGPRDIRLSWQYNAAADYFLVERSANAQSWFDAGQTSNRQFTDSLLQKGDLFYYRVYAVDSAATIPASLPSAIDSARTADNPLITSAEILNEKQLRVIFDRKIRLSAETVASAWRLPDSVFASTVIGANDPHKLFVAFDKAFRAGSYIIALNGIESQEGIPLEGTNSSVQILYREQAPAVIVANRRWLNSNQLEIEFSAPLQLSALTNRENYSVYPSGGVQSIAIPDSSGRKVRLSFDGKVFRGASGLASYVELATMAGQNNGGLAAGTRVGLFEPAENLNALKLYPQPLKSDHESLMFAELPGFVTIYIFDLNGRLIRSLEGDPEYGALRWDLKDLKGRVVANGIYLYTIRYKNQQKTGKIAIIR